MELRKAKSTGRVHQSDTGVISQLAPVVWHGLPLIVQQQILRELSNNYNRDLAEDRKHRASYAAVCLEWQELFEASSANFGKLVLHQSALDAFQKIIQRRQKNRAGHTEGERDNPKKRRKVEAEESLSAKGHMLHIKHIWLRIELQEYSCKNCKESEAGIEKVRCVIRSGDPLISNSD